jgi:hypothetical protein
MRPLPSLLFAALSSTLALSACGGSSSGDTTTAKRAASPPKRAVKVVYATAHGDEGEIGKTLLTAGGTTAIAKALAKNFDLPWNMKVLVRNSSDTGPYYDPETHTINLDYAFTAFIYDQVKRMDPKISDYDLGSSVAAIDAFLYVHEFAHLLIDAFDLPITGREEDAADQLAALFMVKFVDGGEEYAFDAAKFFDSLAGDPSQLAEEDFFDEHSLDKQRAYQIVCWIAGSSDANYAAIEKKDIFTEDRLARCPEEFAQIDHAWGQLLEPHFADEAPTTTTKQG